MRDEHAEWLLMSEPYVTLDEVAMTLRKAITPLASREGIDVAAALIELMVAPDGKWMPALHKLEAATGNAPLSFFEAIDRLGRGSEDREIMNFLGAYNFGGIDDPRVLDAWLRLYERGVGFPGYDPHSHMTIVLWKWDFGGLADSRPDLLKRARAAAAELGLEWPESESRPRHRDHPR
jgi:hypothetical protein